MMHKRTVFITLRRVSALYRAGTLLLTVVCVSSLFQGGLLSPAFRSFVYGHYYFIGDIPWPHSDQTGERAIVRHSRPPGKRYSRHRQCAAYVVSLSTLVTSILIRSRQQLIISFRSARAGILLTLAIYSLPIGAATGRSQTNLCQI